ncbi:MAG: complex I NDUFA9 subunit family protein, partial [Pseudomonadota bacterium]
PARSPAQPETRFQPVYVDDVAAAAEKALTDPAIKGVFELGGPEVETFRALMQRMLEVIRRRKLILTVPFFAARIQGWVFDMVNTLSGGLVPAPVTRDQVKLLARDNVVAEGASGFAELGIDPTEMGAVLDEYLYSYRPYGQYSDITESAKNMKT